MRNIKRHLADHFGINKCFVPEELIPIKKALDKYLRNRTEYDDKLFCILAIYMGALRDALDKKVYKTPCSKKPVWMENGSYIDSVFADHRFFAPNDVLVFEPYNISLQEMEIITSFCKRKNLSCNISGEAEHFPGYTARVEIFPLKELPLS